MFAEKNRYSHFPSLRNADACKAETTLRWGITKNGFVLAFVCEHAERGENARLAESNAV